MIPSIITPMNFTLIRDAVCQVLADCRDNQKELATDSGADDLWIEQLLDFTIYPKRFRYPDISEMPCVFVYFSDISFPGDEQDIYENGATATLQIQYYACGKTETDTDDDGNTYNSKTADASAEDRLNYLTAQIYKILCAEETNIYRGTNYYVKTWRLKSWKRTTTPESDNTIGTVLGAVFEFEVGFDEPTYYTQTNEIKDFYMTLDIQDEFIDPYIRLILDDTEG